MVKGNLFGMMVLITVGVLLTIKDKDMQWVNLEKKIKMN